MARDALAREGRVRGREFDADGVALVVKRHAERRAAPRERVEHGAANRAAGQDARRDERTREYGEV